MLKKFIGESAFKLEGWQYQVDTKIFENKQVIIGFEHTSMMDAILSLALFQIYDIRIHTLIKKELFKGPLKPILEEIGGIPVDRKSSKDIVSQMVELLIKMNISIWSLHPKQLVQKQVKSVSQFVQVFGILPKQPMCLSY